MAGDHQILRLYPTPSELLPEERIYEDLWDPSPSREGRPKVIINMVSSLDGKAAIEGKAGTIGGEADRRVMRILRSRADAVMIGAGTLRSERISLSVPDYLADLRTRRGRKQQPLHIILTSGTDQDLPLENLIEGKPENTIVLAPEDSETGFNLEVQRAFRIPEASRGRVDLASAVRILKEDYSVDLLLVEGGPSLNHELVASSLADDLCLTISPKLLGGSLTNPVSIIEGDVLPTPKAPPELCSAYLSQEGEGDTLFLRYKIT